MGILESLDIMSILIDTAFIHCMKVALTDFGESNKLAPCLACLVDKPNSLLYTGLEVEPLKMMSTRTLE